MAGEKGPARPVRGSRPDGSKRAGDDGSILAGVRAEVEALAAGAIEAARLVGMSERGWRALVTSGRAPAGVRLGHRRVWPVAELRAWLAAGAPSREKWETNRRGGKP